MSSYVLAVDEYGECFVWGAGVGPGIGSASGEGAGVHRAASAAKGVLGPVLLDVLPPHVRVREVACGLGHTLLLSFAGQCFSWGNGGNGRLGLGDVQDRTAASALSAFCCEGDAVKSVQCGASHSMALTAAGLLYCWGKVLLIQSKSAAPSKNI